jgi:hypothetical protein
VKPEDEVPLAIGKIIGNLHSLEFALRLFLYESVGPKDPSLNLERLSVKDRIAENPITNYDSLRSLMKKFNEYLESLGKTDRLDVSLADLRDAIAHGRVATQHPTGYIRLLKFSKPNSGCVSVTTVVELTPEWLAAEIKRTYFEIKKVSSIGRSLGLPFL